ncbi:MAG: glycosyltransferase family 39 protein, partial [bacterium]|nr:glycosyltransferase family 39 protein [Candidatus Colisoma equi]
MKLRAFWTLFTVMLAVRLALMATVPVFEPSEARYAAISANMARSGDFVVPHFTHNLEYQSFDGKPPLVFQAGGLFCKVLGVNEFAVRLFPFLSALLCLFILYHAVRRNSDSETGRLAVLVCLSCTSFYAASGICMTDMTLTCCVAGALLLYRCFLEGFGLGHAAGVMALLGAGMIVKGPVALVMFGLPAFVFALITRNWKGIFNWKWLATAPIFLLVAVPWFVFVEQRNPGAVWYFFYNENFMRFISHEYGDKYGAGREAFHGVSILWSLVATLPWALI